MNGNQKIHIDLVFKKVFEDFEAEPSPEMLENILGKDFDHAVKSSLDGFTPVPVTSVWENISESIPSELDHAFNTSFDGFEVAPPASMWENISESIPSKIDHAFNTSFDGFEVAPSTSMWENISESIPSKIDHAFNTSFDGFEAVPPTSMWASIQSEMVEMDVEANFDNKFQDAFEGFFPTPSAHILNNVLNSEFDTGVRRSFMRHEIEPREAVWDKIKPFIRFTVLRRHMPTLKRVAAVIAIMLLFTFLHNQYNQYSGEVVVKNNTSPKTTTDMTSNTPTQNESEQLSESVPEGALTEHKVSVKQPVTREVVRQNSEVNQAISQVSPVGIGSSRQDFNDSSLPPVINGSQEATPLSPQFPISVENERTDELISSLPKVGTTELERYNTNGIILPTPNIEDLELMDVGTAMNLFGNEYAANSFQSNLIDAEEDNELVRMMLNYSGWYVSSSLSLYNSWILNDAILESFSNENQAKYVVDGNKSFGLGAGYQFTPNFGIETEIVKSRLLQNYSRVTDLNSSNTNYAKADYLYIPLSFRYQTNRLNNNKRIPMTVSAVWGAHYGKLQNSELKSGMPIDPSTSDNFIQQELGLFTGLDGHLYFSPNVHFTFGARLAGGTDFDYLSAPFAADTPYNVQLGVRMGLSYRFASRSYKWKHGIY